ncbi:hypothetical protein EST38_g5307 [Candolleomyces aberdarensis]|uniref:Uncharacterized protein n=1 Tax=Candolleomyces aberdarensis TaxID=2316362 RepID=A0A4Q2DKR3_9AGAR|nr:hypothetical protein EST38_g5307 [Candolleomyces aberdarensis]
MLQVEILFPVTARRDASSFMGKLHKQPFEVVGLRPWGHGELVVVNIIDAQPQDLFAI